MALSPLAQELGKTLTGLLPKVSLREDTLLRAYATFSVWSLALSDTAKREPLQFFKNEAARFEEFFLPLSPQSHPDYVSVSSSFLRYTLSDFLFFATPNLVCNVSRCLKTMDAIPAAKTAHVRIFLIRSTLLSAREASKSCSKQSEYLDICWSIFQDRTSTSVTVSRSEFENLFRSVCCFPLDPKEYSIRSSERDSGNKALALLRSLDRSEEVQLSFAVRCYAAEAVKLGDLASLVWRDRVDLLPQEESKNRLASIKKAHSSVLKTTPLTLAKLMFLSSGQHDITLENGYMYRVFASSLQPAPFENRVAIINPNPFFVDKWISKIASRSDGMFSVETSFVFHSEDAASLLASQYSGSAVHKTIRFCSLDEWFDRLQAVGSKPYSALLLFSQRMTSAEQNRWFRRWSGSRSIANAELYALIGSHEFETARSPFAGYLSDGRLSIHSITIIPQDIKNAAYPRRKLFLHSSYQSGAPQSDKGKTELLALSLFRYQDSQLLRQSSQGMIKTDSSSLSDLDKTIRALYHEELLALQDDRSQRSPSATYQFTPEILFHFSRSWPEHNFDRPRVEAYVCELVPSPDGDFFEDNGNQLKASMKRTSKKFDDEIPHWLEYEYPFSSLSHRRNFKKESQLPEEEEKSTDDTASVVSIRSVLADYYRSFYVGKAVSLKTLWYLYPELDSRFIGKEDKKVFAEMMHTEIGYCMINRVQADELRDLIKLQEFQHKSTLDYRILLITAAEDLAVEKGHLTVNPLLEAENSRQTGERDFFSEVRNALMKRSLTTNQMLLVYRKTVRMLELGHFDYLGVLIRLLTGLESNIICALCFQDLKHVECFDFFQLVLYRQVTNNGRELSGFKTLEDYRLFPVPPVVVKHIQAFRDHMRKLLPSLNESEINECPLFIPERALKNLSSKPGFSSTKNLEKLCRRTTEAAGIRDEIINIPDEDNGVIETNISRYQGDFFRSNFRYHALTNLHFSYDETMYLLGNKPQTTVFQYYCDFANDAAQYILYRKMLRLEALLQNSDFLLSDQLLQFREESASSYTTEVDRSLPMITQTSCKIMLQEPARQPIHLRVQSDFGFDLSILFERNQRHG